MLPFRHNHARDRDPNSDPGTMKVQETPHGGGDRHRGRPREAHWPLGRAHIRGVLTAGRGSSASGGCRGRAKKTSKQFMVIELSFISSGGASRATRPGRG